MTNYTDPKIAAEYLAWTQSENGKIEQDYTYNLIRGELVRANAYGARILDLGCGGGWLAGKLFAEFGDGVEGCDISEPLIVHARQDFPEVRFQVVDFTKPVPYANGEFDHVVMNMSAHSIADPSFAFREIFRILKHGGRVLVTIPNPYYAYPVGEWKRGALGFLFGHKPRLRLRPFFDFLRRSGSRNFEFNGKFTSHFYPLPEHLSNATDAGLRLERMVDVGIREDSAKFDTKYQLYRYPISLFLIFRKD